MIVSSCSLCSPFAEDKTLAYFFPSPPQYILITLLNLNKIRQAVLRGWRQKNWVAWTEVIQTAC